VIPIRLPYPFAPEATGGVAGEAASTITAAAGTSTTSTLTGSSAARGALTAAVGTSTAGTLTGRSVARAAITAADGTSTTSTLAAVIPPGTATISPAAGTSTTSTLAGQSVARASIVAAAGSSSGAILVGRDANAPEEEPNGGGRRIGPPAFTSADYMHWVAHTLGRVAATGVFDA
jgi:hypothetical protein